MNHLPSLFPELSLMPVVVINHADDAVPLANALLEGGIFSIEITLRTPAGLHAIEKVAKHVPEIMVGAGTVIDVEHMTACKNAGAQFQVSPGLTPTLATHAAKHHITWLPGCANASDIMLALEHGFDHIKSFPASLIGGVPMLTQFSGVFPNIRICPTGGVSLSNMAEYAALPSVFAIGGSWLTPKAAIDNKDWAQITTIARQSVDALNTLAQ